MDGLRFAIRIAAYLASKKKKASQLSEASSIEGLFLNGYDKDGRVKIPASLFGEGGGVVVDPTDPEPEPVLTDRQIFINQHTPTIGKNYASDPNFRTTEWKLDKTLLNRREFGEMIIYGNSNYYDYMYFHRSFNLTVGKAYKLSMDIAVDGLSVASGQTGGVHANISNSNRTKYLFIGAIGTTPFIKQEVVFIPTSSNVTINISVDNLKPNTNIYATVRFKNFQLTDAETDTSTLNFNSAADLLREAKYRYPQNSDYGLPNFVERTYEPSNALSYKNIDGLVIEGKSFGHHLIGGTAISLFDCTNVIIRNCKFSDITVKPAVYIEKGSNITVERNEFHKVVKGVLVSQVTVGNIKIKYNYFKNLYSPLDNHRHSIQFLSCRAPGMLMYRNATENILGENNAEDTYNVFNSYGSYNHPIVLKGNWVRGGGPLDPTETSYSGCGMIIGDWGGEYLIAEDNIFVDSSQSGISIGGGNHIIIRNNKQYAPFRAYTRSAHLMYNWTSQYEQTTDIKIYGNTFNWRSRNHKLSGLDASISLRPYITNYNTGGASVFEESLDERILPPDMRIVLTEVDNSGSLVIPTFPAPLPKDTVASIAPLSVTVPNGTALVDISLPATFNVTMGDGSILALKYYTDKAFQDYKPTVAGTYTDGLMVVLPIMGINPTNIRAMVTITVQN